MNDQRILIILLVLLLVVSNGFWFFQYLNLQKNVQKKLDESKSTLQFSENKNEKILNFLKLIIKDILKSEKEVDFETRLKLENAVREIKDNEILDQWQKFTQSQTEESAQKNFKDLLELLINKITP